jgi:glycosyltransferase involved in cell wall biosynthesis
MAGMQQQVREYYWAADFLVLPSRTEGLSNSLIEAFACGLPAIASNVGGALDLISEEDNGFLFESENASALAQALEHMLEQQSEWSAMGDCARQTIIAQADVKNTAYKLKELYL